MILNRNPLGIKLQAAFSLTLRHGRSCISTAKCARLRLSFPYRISQSLSGLGPVSPGTKNA